MIHTIREAFNELLADNDWMDDETRAVAKQKADAMNERIGYPELLTDPDELSEEYVMVRSLCNDSNTPSSKLISLLNG
jgi:membrane metallo-endopeptidase-like protein 1